MAERAGDDLVRVVAERLHKAPFDDPMCDNPKCEEWYMADARRALDAIRSLPVEQRMEAMGMRAAKWGDIDLDDAADPFGLYVEATDA